MRILMMMFIAWSLISGCSDEESGDPATRWPVEEDPEESHGQGDLLSRDPEGEEGEEPRETEEGKKRTHTQRLLRDSTRGR